MVLYNAKLLDVSLVSQQKMLRYRIHFICGATPNKFMKTDVDKLLKHHQKLTQSDYQTVVSHIQRQQGDWIVNTIMIKDCPVPFRYQRKKWYKNLKGAKINLTYYSATEVIAGLTWEVMKVVRIKVS